MHELDEDHQMRNEAVVSLVCRSVCVTQLTPVQFVLAAYGGKATDRRTDRHSNGRKDRQTQTYIDPRVQKHVINNYLRGRIHNKHGSISALPSTIDVKNIDPKKKQVKARFN